MDKRFIPLTPHEQLLRREKVYDAIAAHPEWPFAQVLRYLRTELRLTLPEMSKLCKVAPQTLQKIEHNQASPTLTTVEKILRPFGLGWRVGR